MTQTLAVIPARGGSKDLPGKHLRSFAGLPLIAHSIQFAKMCPEITRCVVSTDAPEIAQIASQFGAEIPFLRPRELAQDDTPIWPVVRHALREMKIRDGTQFDFVILLDPTSPTREPADLTGALERLRASPEADGILSVSRPSFNPLWHCVVERDGWMRDLIEGASRFDRRQEVPPVYRLNGILYVWRAAFVRREERTWRGWGHHLMYEIPDIRGISIDTAEQFEDAERLVREGRITLPWLNHLPTMP